MLLRVGSALPGTGDLEQLGFREVAAYELHRKRGPPEDSLALIASPVARIAHC